MKKILIGFLKIIGIGLALIIIVPTVTILLFAPNNDGRVVKTSKPVILLEEWSESSVYYGCSHIIQRRLKSPATANFPSMNSYGVVVVKKLGTIYVNSYVDSQNSYGAKVRTNWKCEKTNNNIKLWLDGRIVI